MENLTSCSLEDKLALLPKKLSDLMLLALTDLEKCENASEHYKIDMSIWLSRNSHCTVCLAGAVMAQTLGAADSNEVFDLHTNKFLALDAIRQGNFDAAFSYLNGSFSENLPPFYHNSFNDEIFAYQYNKEDWWLHMQAIVGILQAEGL